MFWVAVMSRSTSNMSSGVKLSTWSFGVGVILQWSWIIEGVTPFVFLSHSVYDEHYQQDCAQQSHNSSSNNSCKKDNVANMTMSELESATKFFSEKWMFLAGNATSRYWFWGIFAIQIFLSKIFRMSFSTLCIIRTMTVGLVKCYQHFETNGIFIFIDKMSVFMPVNTGAND